VFLSREPSTPRAVARRAQRQLRPPGHWGERSPWGHAPGRYCCAMPLPEVTRAHIRILVEIKALRAGPEEDWIAGRARLISEAQRIGVRPRTLRQAVESLPPEGEPHQ
jgi:hypothetical protein